LLGALFFLRENRLQIIIISAFPASFVAAKALPADYTINAALLRIIGELASVRTEKCRRRHKKSST